MKKDRNGLPFREFLEEELQDAEIREGIVAKAVAAARKRAGLTQVELAGRLKTDQKAIWRLESGRQNVTVDMLLRIAAATGSSLRLELVPRRP